MSDIQRNIQRNIQSGQAYNLASNLILQNALIEKKVLTTQEAEAQIKAAWSTFFFSIKELAETAVKSDQITDQVIAQHEELIQSPQTHELTRVEPTPEEIGTDFI